MTDRDYCKGDRCNICVICQRHYDYLDRVKGNRDTRYARPGEPGGCSQFDLRRYVGD